MTKKHFIAIADAIRLNGTFSESQIETLGAAFKAINPHFNRYRWTQYIKGNCGPNGGAVTAAKVLAGFDKALTKAGYQH